MRDFYYLSEFPRRFCSKPAKFSRILKEKDDLQICISSQLKSNRRAYFKAIEEEKETHMTKKKEKKEKRKTTTSSTPFLPQKWRKPHLPMKFLILSLQTNNPHFSFLSTSRKDPHSIINNPVCKT